jgi:hypothetical protein
MAKGVRVSRDYIEVFSDEQSFFIGSKHFDTLLKAVETAKTMPEGSIITLKIPVEAGEKAEEEEFPEEEEEESEF